MDDRQVADVAKVLSHPLRIGFLRELRDLRQLSPSDYAEEVREPLSNVGYHVAELRKAGVIQVVETVQRRGAREHYYALAGPLAGPALGVLDMLATA